jgi:hypothetical protein
MAYSTAEARSQLLDDVAAAIDELALALASLGEAYEALDEAMGDALERQLFRPVQGAYGHLRRTYGAFASAHDLPAREFAQRSAGMHSGDPRVYVERAVEAVARADAAITELQDSMMPVEVGDQQLRSGLSHTRELVGGVPATGRELLRTFGR